MTTTATGRASSRRGRFTLFIKPLSFYTLHMAHTSSALSTHARELAKAFGVRLIETDQLAFEEALALPHLRVVLCRTITERMSYAIALHEIGHLVAPLGVLRAIVAGDRSNLCRDEEDAAWAWARHHALEWFPEMEHLAQWGQASYAEPPAAAPADPPAPDPAPIRQHIDWSDWK